jgi:hypothetical protein
LLSVPFNVYSMNAEFSAALGWLLEPFRRPRLEANSIPVWVYVPEAWRDRPKAPYLYVRGDEIPHRSLFPASILTYAAWDIPTQAHRNAPDFLLVHSGSVRFDGGSMLLPGSTGAGKSTLTAMLLERGSSYLSDELGAIDPVTSRIYPFPKRISLKFGSLKFFPGLEERLEDRAILPPSQEERFVPPEIFGAKVAEPAPLRWVVFPGPEREGAPRLSPIAKAEATELLARNALNLYRFQDRGLILLSRVMREAEGYRLDGGDAKARADLLAERFLN